MCHLLSMVLARVPNSVLRAKFAPSLAVLAAVVEAKAEEAPVIKPALSCLCTVRTHLSGLLQLQPGHRQARAAGAAVLPWGHTALGATGSHSVPVGNIATPPGCRSWRPSTPQTGWLPRRPSTPCCVSAWTAAPKCARRPRRGWWTCWRGCRPRPLPSRRPATRWPKVGPRWGPGPAEWCIL